MKSSLVLSVSAPNMDCHYIAKKLAQIGVYGDISTNTTFQGNENFENGCRLTSTVSSKKEIRKIWEVIKSSSTGVKCGHLTVGQFEGCTQNYPWTDNCPGSK